MKNFIIEMLSQSAKVSSKRVVAVVAFAGILVSGFSEQFFGLKPGEQFLGILEMVVIATFGLNSAIDIFKKKEPKE